MLIDKLLYLLIPRAIHEWATTNRARVRAYFLATVLPGMVLAVDKLDLVADDWKVWVTGALASVGTILMGNSVHKVVSPWDEEQ